MQVTRTTTAAASRHRGLEALRQWGLGAPHPAASERTRGGHRLTQTLRGLAQLIREGNAQDLAEYGISLAVIGAGAAAAALVIRGHVAEMWVEHARLLQKIVSVAGS